MVGEIFAERYELEEVLGTGGMSRVYRARDRLLERAVALKVLHDSHHADAEAIERFRREARAVAQLSHPNIVSVIDRGEADGKQFIVFELVEGESLKDLIQRTGPLPVPRALELAIEIGRALAFAHQHGIVHRDVKPQNVVLNGDGAAKVTDFGIARSLEGDGVTLTGTVLGTSNYIAPEQATGGPVDACTDVYALGVVLFELLAGDVPYTGESFLAVAMRHAHDPVPDLRELRPEVPERLAHAVTRAMAKEPTDRFRSMDDFVEELVHCLVDPDGNGDRVDAEVTIVAAPARRVSGPRRVTWPLVVALLGSAAALAAAATAVLLVDGVSLDPPGGGRAAPAQPITLEAVSAHDPEGDGREHPEDVPAATDGDPATYWTTERYNDFARTKSGVGLVVDAGETAKLSELTVSTPTPGFTARIDAGPQPTGPFHAVSGEQTVDGTATFRLRDANDRYYMVWIVDIPSGVARISEVTAGS
jgi:eukaryotic-like serine/threonine-protein kinase